MTLPSALASDCSSAARLTRERLGHRGSRRYSDERPVSVTLVGASIGFVEAADRNEDTSSDLESVSRRLAERIRREGPIPFAVVMEEALYGAGGYYTRDPPAIGADGDYVTGSSLSPLFGRATARVVERVATALGRPADYLEIGYGGGEHLATVASSLAGDGGGRLLAWDRVAREVPPGVRRLTDLGELDRLGIEGVVFSYELFDALAVHRLIGRGDGEVGELLVDWRADHGFTYVEGGLSDPALEELLGEHRLDRGQIADLAPSWRPLYRALARGLKRGLMITCDYGYERARLLDARVRRHGTLASYSRHRVSRDALVDLGQRDLTAHVDFTALREAGEAEGLHHGGLYAPGALAGRRRHLRRDRRQRSSRQRPGAHAARRRGNG